MMKKTLAIVMCGALVASSCGTYEGAGAFTGAQFGSILGSAIGGIADGGRGHDIGTIVGMAGGAAIGGAIGKAKDNKNRQEVRDHYQQVQQRKRQQAAKAPESYSGFDETNSGDDRLYDFGSPEYNDGFNGQRPMVEGLSEGWSGKAVEIRNARFIDDSKDGILSRGEMGRVIFEMYNRTDRTLYDIQPVVEAIGNKHVYVSPSVHVESLAPGKGIRYTALVKGDGSLKKGSVQLVASVRQGTQTVSQANEFQVVTQK